MSSSPDFKTPITTTKKKSTSTKKKRKHALAAESEPRNEGTDPHWAYEPPQGAVLLDHDIDPGPFEWDALNDDDDDDTELWLIRVPDTIKARHLDKLEIEPPASSSRTACIGSITRKHASYDVWSIAPPADDDDTSDTGPGGEDLFGLTCLLPRKEDGRLFVAPKRVARHIVISARPSAQVQPPVYQNPPRHVYPDEVLKHTFVPYGARSVDMDALVEARDQTPPAEAPPKPFKSKEHKAKKRKAQGDSPKKSKKHKTSA